MPYAIMRFEKRKGGPASALERHHERKKEQYASNPDIDRERSRLNYHLVEPKSSPGLRQRSGRIPGVRCARTV